MKPPSLGPVLTVLRRLQLRICSVRRTRATFFLIGGLISFFLVAFLIDQFSQLTPRDLRWLGIAWLSLAGLGTLAICVATRRPDRMELAGLLEKAHPELGERLTTLLQVKPGDPAHGSPGMIEALQRQVLEQVPQLELDRVEPRRAWRWSVASVVVAVMFVGALALFPRLFDFGEDCTESWVMDDFGWEVEWTTYRQFRGMEVLATKGNSPAPTPSIPKVDNMPVSVGDSIVVKLSTKQLHARAVACPEFSLANLDDRTDRTTLVESEGRWICTRSIQSAGVHNFRLEAGSWQSGPLCVEAFPPPIMTRLTMSVKPPGYVNPRHFPEFSVNNESRFKAPQFSTLHVSFDTHRPLRTFQWHREHEERVGWVGKTCGLEPPHWKNVRLQMPLTSPGPSSSKLLLFGEPESSSPVETPLHAVDVWVDSPPRFTALPIASIPKVLPPNSRLSIRIQAEDDLGLGFIFLDYRINSEQAEYYVVAAPDGALRHSQEFHWTLPKANPGNVIAWRLRAQDNRYLRDGSLRLDPQSSFEPPQRDGQDRWHEIVIDDKAASPAEQVIAAQQQDLHEEIRDIGSKLSLARKKIAETEKLAEYDLEAVEKWQAPLQEARKLNRSAQTDLKKLGLELAVEPVLMTFAEKAFALADGELAKSDIALSQSAAADASLAARTGHWRSADGLLEAALKKLQELEVQLDKLARDRLEAEQIESLANQQEELAERTGEPAEMLAEQNKLLDAFDRYSEQSQFMKDSWQKAHMAQFQQMATMADKLAQAQRDNPPDADNAKPGAAQEEIQKGTRNLLDELMKFSQKGDSSKAGAHGKEAMHAAEGALKAMEESKKKQAEGKIDEAKELAFEAALKLEQAGKQAAAMAQEAEKNPPGPADPEISKQLAEAQVQMRTAAKKLAQNQAAAAKTNMQQAAQALHQAAKKAGDRLKQNHSTAGTSSHPNSTPQGAVAQGKAKDRSWTPGLIESAGKSWGELPGELKTRIVQDLQARYGEAYARVIQEYFEEIANVRRRETP